MFLLYNHALADEDKERPVIAWKRCLIADCINYRVPVRRLGSL